MISNGSFWKAWLRGEEQQKEREMIPLKNRKREKKLEKFRVLEENKQNKKTHKK